MPYQEERVGKGIVVKASPKFATMKTEIYDRKGILLVSGDLRYIKLDAEQIVKNADAHEEMCYLIEDGVREIYL